MAKTKRKVTIETKTIGDLVNPLITISGIPTSVEVGDKVIPTVKVERTIDNPIEGVSVDFFVEDSLMTSELGDRQLTDSTGSATASEGYYVPVPEAGNDIKFIIVVQKKVL